MSRQVFGRINSILEQILSGGEALPAVLEEVLEEDPNEEQEGANIDFI